MMDPKVCIIILNWNGKELLKDCLSSIFKLTDYPNYKVIVVDNGSTDGSVEFVRRNFKKVDILSLDRNYGFSKGNNIGIRYALKKYKPKYVLLLNNDTEIIQRDWLKKLVETAESDEKIGIVGPKLIYPDGTLQHYGLLHLSNLIFPHYIERRPYTNFNMVQRAVLATNGACFMVRTKVIKRYNLFYDEIFAPASYEDIDYFWRLFKLGFVIIQRYDVEIVHKLSLSWNKQVEDFRFWLISRNHFIFLLKHFKRFLLIGILSRFITCIFDKKDERPISLKNIVVRRKFYKKIFILIKALFDAIRIYYFNELL